MGVLVMAFTNLADLNPAAVRKYTKRKVYSRVV